MITRYQKKVSGPLMDRIDIHVEVPRVPFEKLSADRRGEPSSVVRERVEAARARQAERFAESGLYCNSEMGPSEVGSGELSDLHAGRDGEAADEERHAADVAVGSGVPPHFEAGADDCGSGGGGGDSADAFGGAVAVSAEGVRLTCIGRVCQEPT